MPRNHVPSPPRWKVLLNCIFRYEIAKRSNATSGTSGHWLILYWIWILAGGLWPFLCNWSSLEAKEERLLVTVPLVVGQMTERVSNTGGLGKEIRTAGPVSVYIYNLNRPRNFNLLKQDLSIIGIYERKSLFPVHLHSYRINPSVSSHPSKRTRVLKTAEKITKYSRE